MNNKDKRIGTENEGSKKTVYEVAHVEEEDL